LARTTPSGSLAARKHWLHFLCTLRSCGGKTELNIGAEGTAIAKWLNDLGEIPVELHFYGQGGHANGIQLRRGSIAQEAHRSTIQSRLILLLFGPPGCGKGTQGRLIIGWLRECLGYTIPSISTGDILRAEIAAGTPLGRETQSIITAGGLVPDDLINAALASRIEQPDCRSGFLLDGYPRTVEQAEYLDKLLVSRNLPSPIVIHLDVPADVLVGRMVSRRQCSKCGQMFNILSKRPKVPGRCDDDSAPLVTRKDDREDVIRERLRTYEEVTRPVVAHYPSDRYFQISGDRSAPYIFEEITNVLESLTGKHAEA
jgi:adenylate kinase